MKNIQILLFCIFFISGCSPKESVTPFDYVTLRKAESHKYEIEIKYIHTVQGGNIHMPFDLKKHVYERAYWIYTDKNKGLVTPDNFVFTHTQNGIEYPYPVNNVKGYIKFMDNKIDIGIQVPRYKNDSDKPYIWIPSELNGTYDIKT